MRKRVQTFSRGKAFDECWVHLDVRGRLAILTETLLYLGVHSIGEFQQTGTVASWLRFIGELEICQNFLDSFQSLRLK